MKDLFSLAAYDYQLPEELIAKHPTKRREDSRLMLVDRSSGQICEMPFFELGRFLQKGDLLVFNDTKVIPARLHGTRTSGGAAEVFLLKSHGDGVWDALVRPGRKLKIGDRVIFSQDFACEMISTSADGIRQVRFTCNGDFDSLLQQHGRMPLPHYMERPPSSSDIERYQTIFAAHPGAVAAPTAALHFSKEMIEDMQDAGIDYVTITLHVGAGTFRPVQTDDIRTHVMHTEPFWITPTAAEVLNRQPHGRRICVGTTSCRALESAASHAGVILPGAHQTSIFIYPGIQFKYVSSLLTNFHLPKSSLLMLVSAFAGYELIMEAYAKAIERGFRFYSYGDAMLVF